MVDTIGVGFTPDWMKKWCKIFKPNELHVADTKHRKTIANESRLGLLLFWF